MATPNVPDLAIVPFSFFRDFSQMCALVPEWAALTTTRECNGWHCGESTLEHTLQVIKNSRALLRRPSLAWLLTILDRETIEGRTLHELFVWATLLHDIAKPYTQDVDPERQPDMVLYPGHEAKGAEMAPPLMWRHEFTLPQRRWVADLVRHHGSMHGFFGKPEEEFQVACQAWEDQHGPMFSAILYLHSWADTIGSRLEEHDPEQYDLRLQRYEMQLQRLKAKFALV